MPPLRSDLDPRLLRDLAVPLLNSLETLLRQQPGSKPAVGLTAPVGAGKSTLATQLQSLAAARGMQLAVASIDDAYHCWPERQQRMAGNPFGVNRVPPGSHEPELLKEAIAHWRGGKELVLPRFDKTLRNGHGDRCGYSSQQADALLLEGWLVGYEPVGPEAVASWSSRQSSLSERELAWLPHWDQALADYVPLWESCSSFWVLQPSNWNMVLRWRLQAEARQRRARGNALGGDAVKRMVRATLASLPPELYQQQLIHKASAVATLNGWRRCLDVTPGAAQQTPENQASPSSSLIGYTKP